MENIKDEILINKALYIYYLSCWESVKCFRSKQMGLYLWMYSLVFILG